MYCKYCGNEIINKSKFCTSCGKETHLNDIYLYKNFSINESLLFGWNIVKKNFLPSFLLTSIILLSAAIPNKGFASFVSWCISIYSLFMLTKISIFVSEGSFKLNKKLFFSNKNNLLNFIGAYILWFSVIVIGLMFLILPGIYFSIRLFLWNYIIVDEKCSPISSLQRSWQLTKGYEIKILKWIVTSIGINLLGVLFFFVGVVITIPLTTYTEYYIYKKLKYGK